MSFLVLVMMSRGSSFTLPIVLAAARTETSLGDLIGDCWQQASQFPLCPGASFQPAPAKILCFWPVERGCEVMDEKSIKTRPGLSRPTIRDVARLAGVSLGTASKALSGQGRMRPETRRMWSKWQRISVDRTTLRKACTATEAIRWASFRMTILADLPFLLSRPLKSSSQTSASPFSCQMPLAPSANAKPPMSLMAKRVDGFVVTARRADRLAVLILQMARRSSMCSHAPMMRMHFAFCQMMRVVQGLALIISFDWAESALPM